MTLSDLSEHLEGVWLNRSSWSLRIRGHGDFENFPAIPVFGLYEVLLSVQLLA